ncbi:MULTISPECIES: helix-turn-helix domain-containing protein [Vibrio]|nr:MULTISPECIES: helix-turn-helix domain-containing protein [Vibrio harveyi group]
MKEIAIKQRFYPTTEQAQLLAQTFGCAFRLQRDP